MTEAVTTPNMIGRPTVEWPSGPVGEARGVHMPFDGGATRISARHASCCLVRSESACLMYPRCIPRRHSQPGEAGASQSSQVKPDYFRLLGRSGTLEVWNTQHAPTPHTRRRGTAATCNKQHATRQNANVQRATSQTCDVLCYTQHATRNETPRQPQYLTFVDLSPCFRLC